MIKLFQTSFTPPPSAIINISSLEMHASKYISAKLKKHTYTYELLQFSVETNTRGNKILATFIPYHTKYDLQVHSFD